MSIGGRLLIHPGGIIRATATLLSILLMPIIARSEEAPSLAIELRLNAGFARSEGVDADEVTGDLPCYCSRQDEPAPWAFGWGATLSVSYRLPWSFRAGVLGQWNRQSVEVVVDEISRSITQLQNQFDVGPVAGVELDVGPVYLLVDFAGGYAMSDGIPRGAFAPTTGSGWFVMPSAGVRYVATETIAVTGRVEWVYRSYRSKLATTGVTDSSSQLRVSIGMQVNVL